MMDEQRSRWDRLIRFARHSETIPHGEIEVRADMLVAADDLIRRFAGQNRAVYYEGLIAGIERYAHSDNGVQYVGTTGRTLEEVRAEVYEEGRREGVYRGGTADS
jgi:hypothetical protein